jgi:hypothetical protein
VSLSLAVPAPPRKSTPVSGPIRNLPQTRQRHRNLRGMFRMRDWNHGRSPKPHRRRPPRRGETDLDYLQP